MVYPYSLVHLFVLIAFAVFLLYKLLMQNREKLSVSHGFYWDKKKNPYCPSCQTPLLFVPKELDHHGKNEHLYCLKCNAPRRPLPFETFSELKQNLHI
jgi:hypothetical protein